MNRKIWIICGLLVVVIFISSCSFAPSSTPTTLRLKIPSGTQVVWVAEARHFSDIELENQNQIGPEDFLKKMERGEFKVVLFPKSSSIESFRTIGFSKYVYVVGEKEWKDWFWKNFKSSKSFFPYDVKIKKEDSQLRFVIGFERTIKKVVFSLLYLIVLVIFFGYLLR